MKRSNSITGIFWKRRSIRCASKRTFILKRSYVHFRHLTSFFKYKLSWLKKTGLLRVQFHVFCFRILLFFNVAITLVYSMRWRGGGRSIEWIVLCSCVSFITAPLSLFIVLPSVTALFLNLAPMRQSKYDCLPLCSHLFFSRLRTDTEAPKHEMKSANLLWIPFCEGLLLTSRVGY